MLVPSHYSHETERMLINEFGGTGLNNIECTTFEKMSGELVKTALPKIAASGKRVLILRAIKQCLCEFYKKPETFNSRLLTAVGRQGFVEVAVSFISELCRYNVTYDELINQAEAADNELTKQKLTVMAEIFEKYQSLLSNARYLDSEDDLARLANAIRSGFDRNKSIWIDKFDELLPQQLDVLKALIDTGIDITITFSTCPDFDDTYYATKNAISEISSYTKVKRVHLNGEMAHNVNAPDLHFLLSTWFDRSVYENNTENAEVFIARDAYTEIEHTACKILDLVRENGYRFKNIGIVCANVEQYSHIIEAVFDEYEIPYYSDEKISIAEYPIAMQILSLFDIIERGWDYQSVFAYLRSGFVYTKTKTKNGKVKYTRISPDELDILENYVLKYGIKYKSSWCRSWLEENKSILDTAFEKEAVEKPSTPEMLENLRQKVTGPILAYSEAVSCARTVTDYCKALYEFLENINLYQGLKSELLSMAINNATADAQRFGQIWNLCLDVLDQVNTALGDEEVSHEEFCEYIRSAMQECQIRTVPSGIDRVFIGGSDMNRAINTKVVFIIGAVSGTFPSISTVEGFLSNAEREMLAKNNLHLAPTTLKKAEKQRNTVYKLIAAVEEKLFISYPSMTSEGASCTPSQTVTDIIRKLKNIRIIDDVISDDDSTLYISTPKATLHKRFISPTDHPLWVHVDRWFDEHDVWKNRLFTVNKAKSNYLRRRISLNPEIAGSLFDGRIRYSATRLNSYAQCPFSHYLKYGLRAKEREEYEMNAADTGTYAHEIIRRFCETVDGDSELDWKTLDEQKCEEIVSGLVSDTLDRINDSAINDKEFSSHILARMGKTVAKAANAVCKSIQCGHFKTDAYEKEISVSITDDIEVGGIIDRLDVCKHDGVNEYRIIDYKTGRKTFEVRDIYHGLDMQPVIYALAMRMIDKDAVISGMYYSLVHNKFASIEATSRESTAMNKLRKNTAFEGITFVGSDSKNEIPQAELDRIESEISRKTDTLFFKEDVKYGKNIKTRQDGEILMEMVRDKIVKSDREIRGGNIEISPLASSQMHSCNYCAYSSVCKFDEKLKTERLITETDAQVWEFLEEEY